jgi:serine/threonine protein kinase
MPTRSTVAPVSSCLASWSLARQDVDDATRTRMTDTPHRPLHLEAEALLAELRGRMFQRAAEPWIGRFRLVRSLGRGSYGSVVEAEDTELERRIALKVMRARAEVGDDAPIRRMLREARALAKLSHPNVVQVFDAGVNEGRVWIAMELVRGTTLREWEGTTNDAKLDVLHQAGRGLAAAHALGILHRDFKPGNVLVGEDGRVRVADFGLARPEASDDERLVTGPSSGNDPTPLESITGGGMMVGTLRYMSPEQLRAERLDARSDQFNFAVTAWEVLLGVPPSIGCSRRSHATTSPSPIAHRLPEGCAACCDALCRTTPRSAGPT